MTYGQLFFLISHVKPHSQLNSILYIYCCFFYFWSTVKKRRKNHITWNLGANKSGRCCFCGHSAGQGFLEPGSCRSQSYSNGCSTWASLWGEGFLEPGSCRSQSYSNGCSTWARFGVRDMILESDCQSVIKRLSKHAFFLSDLDIILYDILASWSSLSSFVWSHVKCDGNFVAHHLAKLLPFGVEQILEKQLPPEVTPYVLMDKLSLN